MTRSATWIAAGLAVAALTATAHAQAVTAPVASPVDHPLLTGQPVRTAGAWRKGVERFGETLAGGSLRLRGYEVVDAKLPGNRGIDLVAVKRGPAGTVTDVRLIEVKTRYGQGRPRLGMTRDGLQTSRTWFAARLLALRSAGEPGRKLALEISRFRRAEGIPLERLGEVHDVNLRTGRYTVRDPVGMAGRAGPVSIERLLGHVSGHSAQPASRAWATRHLSQLDQLRQARMGNWLSAGPPARAFDRVSSAPIVLLEEAQARRGARRGLVRAAGRVAVVVAVAADAYDIYGHARDYRLGHLSRQQFAAALARSAGGIAGAWAGAAGGAWVGVQVGALGGPWAWVTVPVGGVVGGAVGGVAGYLGGSHAGEFTARAWYGSLDGGVRERVSGWLKETPHPVGG